ncbi:MAG: starch-binding protein, partial [Acutalibacteraceae bacterium]
MNGKFKKITSIALVLAMLLTQMCFAVIGADATSSSQGETVYFKLPAEWTGRVDTTTGETVLPAAYTAGGTSGEAVPWVGTHMTKVEGTEDIYSFTIPADQTFVIFNTGMQRDWQTGELALSGGDMLFVVDSDIETKNAIGHWEPYNTDAPKVSINTGTFNFVGKKDIELSRFNSTSGTYSINGGEELPFENGQIVTIGEGIAPDSDVNLVLTATNGTDTVSYEYTFHKSPSVTVFAKNNAGWKDVYVHYWGGESASIWPGVAMTPYEGSDTVFYAELPSKTTNYKFNNNMSGTASEEQTVNLAMQDLVPGAAECYIINKLNEGETANTGEYTTIDRALSDMPEEGKPIISVADVEGALDSEINVPLYLQNVPAVSGYVIEISYDATAIEPIVSGIDSSIIANVRTPGKLYISYACANPSDFTEKAILATIPFKVIGSEASQTKITADPKQMFADENERIIFPSSNIVSGKATVGVDKSVLKEKLDYAKSLNANDYTATSFQALETAVNAAQLIYDLPTATQEAVDGQVQALELAISELIVESDDGNYFYFKNVVGWGNVYAYWWGSETACPAFPGVKATLVEGTSDVYRVELPDGATGLNFNDGKNTDGDKAQTDSITGDNLKIGNIFIPDPNDYYEKNNGIRYRGVSKLYVPNKIYFKNVAGWDEVYAYWWGGTTACPAFPGVKPKLLNGTTDIYWITFPEDATGFNFNNGKSGTDGGEQTSSMSVFERGRILIMDLDSKYEKNGGFRYDAAYDDLA